MFYVFIGYKSDSNATAVSRVKGCETGFMSYEFDLVKVY